MGTPASDTRAILYDIGLFRDFVLYFFFVWLRSQIRSSDQYDALSKFVGIDLGAEKCECET